MVEILFNDIVLITAVSAVLVWIFARLKQPPLLAYLVVGVLLGPELLDVIGSRSSIEVLARFGVAFLLFIVGLELDISEFKRIGKISLIAGTGQILFTTVAGFGISSLMGYGTLESVYIAVALTFSSTIVVVKILSEKRDLQSLYGRISIGFLLVQDLVAVFTLMVFGFIPKWSEGVGIVEFAMVFGTAIAFFGVVALIAWKFIPLLFRSFARNQESLFLGAIAWCFLVAVSSEKVGVPFEAGALMAGIALAPLTFSSEISGKIRSLRDFFMILFFVVLGMNMNFYLSDIPAIAAFSLFVLIGNPLIVMIIMGFMGYHRRISFFSGLTVAQISEFSLIIASMGLMTGHISSETAAIITSVGVITIAISTYILNYNEQIYNKIHNYLRIFQKSGVEYDENIKKGKFDKYVVMFGGHQLGRPIAKKLREIGAKIVVVDFDPEVIDWLKQRNYSYFYGDATDYEVLENLELEKANMIVSTIPEFKENKILLEKIRNLPAKKIFTAGIESEMLELYKLGADYVMLPRRLGGQQASKYIAFAFENPEKFSRLREEFSE